MTKPSNCPTPTPKKKFSPFSQTVSDRLILGFAYLLEAEDSAIGHMDPRLDVIQRTLDELRKIPQFKDITKIPVIVKKW